MIGIITFLGVGVVILALIDTGLYKIWLGRYNWR